MLAAAIAKAMTTCVIADDIAVAIRWHELPTSVGGRDEVKRCVWSSSKG